MFRNRLIPTFIYGISFPAVFFLELFILENLGTGEFSDFVITRSSSNLFLVVAGFGLFSIGQKLLVRNAQREFLKLMLLVLTLITLLGFCVSLFEKINFSLLMTYAIFANNLVLLLVKSLCNIQIVAFSRISHLVFLALFLAFTVWEKSIINTYSIVFSTNAITWLSYILLLKRKELLLPNIKDKYHSNTFRDAAYWWLSNILNSSYRQGELVLFSVFLSSSVIAQWRFMQILIDGSRMLSGLFIEAEFKKHKSIDNLMNFIKSTSVSVLFVAFLSIAGIFTLYEIETRIDKIQQLDIGGQLLVAGSISLLCILGINWVRHIFNFLDASKSVLSINLLGLIILASSLAIFESILAYAMGWVFFLLISLIVSRYKLGKMGICNVN